MVAWLAYNQDFIVGVIVILGVAVGALHKFGLIHFGRDSIKPVLPEVLHPTPAFPACPDPACKEHICGTIEGVKRDIKEFKEEVFPKINRTVEGVARIEGWIEAQRKR